jgi:citrate lyase subunit beta-like protein
MLVGLLSGKQVIHPDQVPIVQQAFSPSEEEIAWAQRLIAAFEEHQTSGKVCALDAQ